MKAYLVLAFCSVILFQTNVSLSQQTVGLFLNTEEATEGYTFFAPMPYGSIYLVDNCGRKVHEWDSQTAPYYSGFILEDGSVIYSERIATTPFDPSFPSGTIVRRDWDGNVIWEFENDDWTVNHHHDFKVLENGNILVITNQKMNPDDALAEGRNPEYINEFIAGTTIVEYQPLPVSGAIEVWRWESFDHLVQDYDSEKNNYGDVSEEFRKIDFNYGDEQSALVNSDWMHSNTIEYHPEYDQIIISTRNFSEFWIIDHSTTTEEAATSEGGIYGHGGDLLYRWGNPEAYQRGEEEDQTLFYQHDAQWLLSVSENPDNIIVFNNRYDQSGQSQLLEITPPMSAPGVYEDPGNDAFGPTDLVWSYTEEGFYSPNISGLQRFENGNTLVCQGFNGRLFELNSENEIVWEYVNPINNFGPLTQENDVTANSVFQAIRYPVDFPGFEGKDLTPGDPIELEFYPVVCPVDTVVIVDTLDTIDTIDTMDTVWIHEVARRLNLEAYFRENDNSIVMKTNQVGGELIIFTALGEKIYQENIQNQVSEIRTSPWKPGVYILCYEMGDAILTRKLTIY